MAIYTGRNEDSSGNILLSIGNGMTDTLETGTTASQAYTKGAYVFFDNKLCKATSAIASGATLAIGTNLAQTSIGVELTSHLRSSDAKEFYFDVKDGKYGFYPSASKVASEFVPFGGTLSKGVITSVAETEWRNISLGYIPSGVITVTELSVGAAIVNIINIYNSAIGTSVKYVQGATNGGGTVTSEPISTCNYIQLTSDGFKCRALPVAQGFTVRSIYYYAWK